MDDEETKDVLRELMERSLSKNPALATKQVRLLAKLQPSSRLPPAELESLRKATAESMAWMRAQLKGSNSATAKRKKGKG